MQNKPPAPSVSDFDTDSDSSFERFLQQEKQNLANGTKKKVCRKAKGACQNKAKSDALRQNKRTPNELTEAKRKKHSASDFFPNSSDDSSDLSDGEFDDFIKSMGIASGSNTTAKYSEDSTVVFTNHSNSNENEQKLHKSPKNKKRKEDDRGRGKQASVSSKFRKLSPVCEGQAMKNDQLGAASASSTFNRNMHAYPALHNHAMQDTPPLPFLSHSDSDDSDFRNIRIVPSRNLRQDSLRRKTSKPTASATVSSSAAQGSEGQAPVLEVVENPAFHRRHQHVDASVPSATEQHVEEPSVPACSSKSRAEDRMRGHTGKPSRVSGLRRQGARAAGLGKESTHFDHVHMICPL